MMMKQNQNYWYVVFFELIVGGLSVSPTVIAQNSILDPYHPMSLIHNGQPIKPESSNENYDLGATVVSRSIEDISGTSYVKYTSKHGAILIERLNSSAVDVSSKAAIIDCTSVQRDPSTVDVAKIEHRMRFEVELVDSITLDYGIVNNLIVEKCSGRIVKYESSWRAAELGITYTSKDKTEYRLFYRPLSPMLGLYMRF